MLSIKRLPSVTYILIKVSRPEFHRWCPHDIWSVSIYYISISVAVYSRKRLKFIMVVHFVDKKAQKSTIINFEPFDRENELPLWPFGPSMYQKCMTNTNK